MNKEGATVVALKSGVDEIKDTTIKEVLALVTTRLEALIIASREVVMLVAMVITFASRVEEGTTSLHKRCMQD